MAEKKRRKRVRRNKGSHCMAKHRLNKFLVVDIFFFQLIFFLTLFCQNIFIYIAVYLREISMDREHSARSRELIHC